jgi:ABC-type Fe3+ transport system permease subunit
MKTLHFWPIAWTLAVFSAVVFTLDIVAGLLFPNWWVMQKAWEVLLPGFTFISWGAFFLGLVESFIGGFLTAVLFVPIYNYFTRREAPKTAPTMKPVSEHH